MALAQQPQQQQQQNTTMASTEPTVVKPKRRLVGPYARRNKQQAPDENDKSASGRSVPASKSRRPGLYTSHSVRGFTTPSSTATPITPPAQQTTKATLAVEPTDTLKKEIIQRSSSDSIAATENKRIDGSSHSTSNRRLTLASEYKKVSSTSNHLPTTKSNNKLLSRSMSSHSSRFLGESYSTHDDSTSRGNIRNRSIPVEDFMLSPEPTKNKKADATSTTMSLESISPNSMNASATTSPTRENDDYITPLSPRAKPSAIKARLKEERIKRDKIRQREAEAQLRMQRIKAEIKQIEKRESMVGPNLQLELKQLRHVSELARLAKGADTDTDDDMMFMTECDEVWSTDEGDLEDSSHESMHAGSHDDDSDDNEGSQDDSHAPRQFTRQNSRKVISQMNSGFAMLSASRNEKENKDKAGAVDRNSGDGTIVGADEAAALEAKKEQLRAKLLRSGSKRGQPKRNPSNLVPEMRRRISRRDIMFDEDDAMKASSENVSATRNNSTHSTNMDSEEELETGDKEASSTTGTASRANTRSLSANDASIAASRPSKSYNRRGSSFNITTKDDMAKVKKEKEALLEQREKLDEAKEDFQRGHDMCWKFQDSPGALMEFRKALFIRESLLGKFHEDTGRTYYWIGRSLVKLKEFEEALVAFSRALRIFERVLMKNHKYVKWTRAAFDSIFRELEYDGSILDEYKRAVEDSIEHERVGDLLRKKGKLSEAVLEYRDAIDNIEEYHPDAADLYCKIAIILRSQGEFERALDEYRYASEIYELSLGADHPETVKTLNNLIEKKRLGQVSMALMQQLNNRNG